MLVFSFVFCFFFCFALEGGCFLLFCWVANNQELKILSREMYGGFNKSNFVKGLIKDRAGRVNLPKLFYLILTFYSESNINVHSFSVLKRYLLSF